MNSNRYQQAEEAKQEALDRLQKIASQLPGVVFQFRLRPDGSSCVPYASEAARKIYRLRPEEVREDATKVFTTIHPDDLENFMASIQISARDLTPWQHEYRLKFDDGTVRWVFGNSIPQREADGATLWHGFITDITERKLAEVAQRLGRDTNQRYLNMTQTLMVELDGKGKITMINRAAQNLLGYAENELLGRNWFETCLPQPEGMEIVYPVFCLLMSGEKASVNEFENVVLCRDGRQRLIAWLNTYLTDENGQIAGTLSSGMDITERKQAEESIRAEQEIRASHTAIRKLAARTEDLREDERKTIAREVHDELGQVLSVLRMDIALLKDRTGMKNAVMDGIERNMLALVDRAIQGVRNIAGSLRPVQLGMGCVAAIELQCAEFTKNSGIPCPVKVTGDIFDLDERQTLASYRIVQESLTNIMRHAAATSVEITIANAGTIEVEIRDNGKGFDPEKTDSHKSFGLLGMRERAISIGGELNITGKPGQGTVVTLRIPDDPTKLG